MTADERIAALAAKQYGLVTRKQALGRGLSDSGVYRRVRSGHWVQVHPGVFRLSGAPYGWVESLKAATMAAPRSFASHMSAARLLGLPMDTEAVELTVLSGQAGPADVKVHRPRSLDAVDRSRHLSIPTTSVARTIIDLAGAVPKETLEDVLDSALARRLVPLPYLVDRLEALGVRGRAGAGAIGELLAERAGQTRFADSQAQRVLWKLIQARGWSGWVQEHCIELGDGRRIYVDAACPPFKYGVELDSFRWHSQMSQWASDHERTAAAVAAGWSLLPVTPHRLDSDPGGVADQILEGLERRGFRASSLPDAGREVEQLGAGGEAGEAS